MLTRASKYLVPVGTAAVVCIPTTVYADSKCPPPACKPACIYDEPKKDACGRPIEECEDTQLERIVMQSRQKLGPAIKQFYVARASLKELIGEGYGAAKCNLRYLRTKAPEEVRIGTIVAAGLFGMMLGYRRGLARKIVLGAAAAGGASYLVYPEETMYYVNNGVPIAKKYASIAYNFAVGGGPEPCPPKPCPASTVKKEKAERNIRGGNSTLTEHLKRCVGLGCNLPPLIEKCEDVPGFCDKKKASSCGSAFPCPGGDKPKPKEECKPKKIDCNDKCPPMPTTDCSKCRPAWIECPPSRFTKTYPVPKGINVQPISVGGRNGTGGTCNRCGDKPRKPKVSANCPMMRPKCPGVAEENKGGFFAKIMALFGKK